MAGVSSDLDKARATVGHLDRLTEAMAAALNQIPEVEAQMTGTIKGDFTTKAISDAMQSLFASGTKVNQDLNSIKEILGIATQSLAQQEQDGAQLVGKSYAGKVDISHL
ncbi:MAG: hypothetical protein J2P18_08165 [Nocardia sp.]|nr:hypothetical protein [Nocardia sp.]